MKVLSESDQIVIQYLRELLTKAGYSEIPIPKIPANIDIWRPIRYWYLENDGLLPVTFLISDGITKSNIWLYKTQLTGIRIWKAPSWKTSEPNTICRTLCLSISDPESDSKILEFIDRI